MKITRHILAVVLILFINQGVAQQSKSLQDFESAWITFAKAIVNSDTMLLTKLSIDTIHCPLCAENTNTEQKIMNRIRSTTAYPDTLYNFLAKIPTIVFYRDDLYSFFDGNEIKSFVNRSKVSFSCLDSTEKLYEAHVHIDRLGYGKPEGFQFDFQFRLVNNKYKFVAFYSTP